MKKRPVVWIAFVLFLLTGLALLVPASPAYLPAMFGPGGRFGHSYKGHFTGHWVETLKSPQKADRLEAMDALGMIGPDAADGVPALAELLAGDPDREIRSRAGLALSKMVPASAAAVPALAKALSDDEPVVRMNAAVTLFRLRTDARPAVPALRAALKDKANETNADAFMSTIQEMAALALGRATAGSDEAVPDLLDALRDAKTQTMRQAAARALGEVGVAARSAAPQLRELLKDNSKDVQDAAREALEKIGEGSVGKGD